MNYSKRSINQKIEDISGQELRQKNRFKMFLVALFVALFAGSVIVGISTGIGAFIQIIRNSPSVEDLNSISPTATKSIIYAADGSIMQELVEQGSNRESVTYDKLPDHLVKAFVAIEDSRFFTHDGVDVKGIFRALFVGLKSGHLSEGASTLTQQLIKNNIFNGGMESNFGDRIERKFQEQYLALRVESELDKNLYQRRDHHVVSQRGLFR